MPNNDFSVTPDRRADGAEKWESMYRDDPDLRNNRAIVPLSVADMEFKTPPAVAAALEELARDRVLGYTGPTQGYVESVLGWQERRHGWRPKASWLVSTPGVVPAIALAVRSLTKPGDGVIIQTPVYYPFRMMVEAAGRTVVENPLVLKGERYVMDYADLERKAARKDVSMIVLCSPHNPVGRVWRRDELRKLADICLAHDVIIVSDEIHDDLVMPDHLHTTLCNVLSREERKRCVVCTAPSKTFNLAGVQCSNIFIPGKKLRRRFKAEAEGVALFSLNAFAYTACQAAYNESEDWLEQLLAVVWSNHQMLVSFVREHFPGVKAFPLEGTYLQWVDFSCWGMEPEELERFMKKEARLYLDEGTLFGTGGAGFERINLACTPSVLQDALYRLLAAARVRKLPVV